MLSIQGHAVNIIKSGLKDTETQHVSRHAEIEIDGKLHAGDVVFTETIKAFYDNQRHLDSRLNRCILHIATRDEFTNLRIRLQNGKTIPTLIM